MQLLYVNINIPKVEIYYYSIYKKPNTDVCFNMSLNSECLRLSDNYHAIKGEVGKAWCQNTELHAFAFCFLYVLTFLGDNLKNIEMFSSKSNELLDFPPRINLILN